MAERLRDEFKRQAMLCSGLGEFEQLELVKEYWAGLRKDDFDRFDAFVASKKLVADPPMLAANLTGLGDPRRR